MSEARTMNALDGDVERRGCTWLGSALGLSDGQEPFPWQLELLRRFLCGERVDALDVPTGLGKTAVMATWLVARACGAQLPRRLVYVVDRRAVVDQATEVAEGLRAWVARESCVAKALGLGERGLPISTLRGQHIDNRDWLADPSAPAIVVGTVDMIGSRLLFSGYGVSRKMRPYHAGLLGNDALIVLDEAHLAQPFERLIEQIGRGVDVNGQSLRPELSLDALVPGFRCLSLSATGRERDHDHVLGLTEDDRRPGGVAAKRLHAAKWLSIRPDVGDKELPEALAAEAWALADAGATSARVIVFCTRREHAKKVRESLEKRAKNRDIATVLFVGGRRVYEREGAASRLRELGFIAGSTARPSTATFVIATSAGEVGVDLDADHAVCDLVAWERMVQRFGRVNRRGEGAATIVVVPAPASDGQEQARRDATREVFDALPKNDAVDVSLAALVALKDRASEDGALRTLVARATTPAPLHPPLTRALVESWSMTSLDEHTGRPEVAPWIRGWPEVPEEPRVTLVWRRFLPLTADGRPLRKRDLGAFLDAAAPHLAERLETETWRAMEWLEKRVKSLKKSEPGGVDSDVASLATNDVVAVIMSRRDAELRIVRGTDLSHLEVRKHLERSMEGGTLWLDLRVGGLSEGLLDDTNREPTIDVTEVGTESARIVPFRVRRVTDEEEANPSEGWRTEAAIAIRTSEDGDQEWLVVESVASAAAESEEGRSSARRAQSLAEHEAWAEEEARRIIERLGVSKEHGEMIAAAARLHDEGKKASRWQRAFRVPREGGPYAKSTVRPNIASLEGYRHELGSLPYAEAHPRVKALAPELRELCLHVIAAHHGGARPVIRTAGAEEPPSRLVRRAREIALRFAAEEKRWGPWGLAWWEAVLRAADQRASQRNDEEGDARG